METHARAQVEAVHTSALATRVFLVVISLLAAGVYSWFAIRGYEAFRLSGIMAQNPLERAIAIEPQNAFAFNALCRYRMNIQLDAHGAIPSCARAVELNRYDAAYWLDLAEAYFETGNQSEQLRAIQGALAAAPATPDVAWTAANLFLARGDIDQALSKYTVALKNDPSLAPQVIAICWRRTGEVEPILRMLPPISSVYLDAIRLFDSERRSDFSSQIWDRLFQLRLPVDYHQALFYISDLLSEGNTDTAERVRDQLAVLTPEFAKYASSDSLVVNGSFELEVLNGGFDWRLEHRPGTSLAIDTSQFVDGSRSLEISFDGRTPDAGIYQLVPVNPAREYTASAWVRSEELKTANGPSLTVSDPQTGAVYGRSEETAGTRPWHQVAAKFVTDAKTRLVKLQFARDPKDTLVTGRFWVDNVQLVESRGSAQISAQ